MTASRVTDTDHGADAFLARIRALKASKARVRVGVLADAAKDPPKDKNGKTGKPPKYTLLEVAGVHEFGAPAANIPQRSFIRAPIDAHAEDITRLQAVLLTQIVEGRITEAAALDLLGAKVASWCQEAIDDGIEPALADETVQRKGSSKPLVNTGQLKSAITWQVE